MSGPAAMLFCSRDCGGDHTALSLDALLPWNWRMQFAEPVAEIGKHWMSVISTTNRESWYHIFGKCLSRSIRVVGNPPPAYTAGDEDGRNCR
jgi:hypothetical protein